MLGCRHASLNRFLKSLQFYINWNTMEFLCLSHALQAPEISHALWYLKLQETIILQILNLLLGSYYQYLHFCGPCFYGWLDSSDVTRRVYTPLAQLRHIQKAMTPSWSPFYCVIQGVLESYRKGEKIILYPSFCVHARLCPIITLPWFISPQTCSV